MSATPSMNVSLQRSLAESKNVDAADLKNNLDCQKNIRMTLSILIDKKLLNWLKKYLISRKS